MTKTTTTRGKEAQEKERIKDDGAINDEDEAKMMMIKEVVRDACEEGGYTLRRRRNSSRVNECTTTETTKGGEGGGGGSYRVSLEEQILILSTSSSEIKFDVDDFLRRLVHEVKEYARPPTSNFHVGAACLTNRGNIFLGVNVEVEKCALNRSVHAEQCMIMNAMVGIRNAELEEYRRKEKMKGGKTTKEEREKERRKEHKSNNNNNNESNEEEEKEKIVKIAITHAPCGHCRQFMNELRDAKDIQILLPGMAAMRLEELLPKAFGPLDLEVPGDEEHREERIKRRKSEGSDAIVVDEEKVHVRTLLLDGCPPNPRDRDGLGTMEKFCKLMREALEDGRIRFGQHSFGNLEEEALIFAAIEELAHTMAHSYAPYTDSPCAIAIPAEDRWKTGDKISGMRFYFGASVECAAYNPSMTPMHAMQVALHCTPFRPSSYKRSSPAYGHIGTRPLFWSRRRCPISIYVFGFRDAKISYAETLKKEFEDIARRCDTDYAPHFIMKEILFDRHMFSVEDPHAVIVREYERIRSRFVEVLDWYSL